MEAIIAQIGVYSAIALAAIELAKRIAEVVPGKKDDEVVGMVESIVRHLIDFVAGRSHGKPNDPSLVKRD